MINFRHFTSSLKLAQGGIKVFLPIVIFLIVGISFSANAQTLPQLPKTYLNTTYYLPSGKVITVNSGGDFQAALNSANLGDIIVLQAGATFTGPYTLPNKTSGSGWIYIQSSNYANLPGPCNRVGQSDSSNMPKIVVTAASGGAIQTVSNSHNFRFVGIEIKPVAANFVYDLVTIGSGDSILSTLPYNIVFDRCYIHGDTGVGGRRGVEMDGDSIAVINSYVSDFKEQGSDAQALWAYNTPGPIKVVNNYLEASTENMMFGGADPAITNLVVSDIEIRGNYFFKPMAWKGSLWQIKNLLEFKNAQRVLVEGNRFENNWAANQNGMSLLLTPRNQNGNAPWCTTRDITIKMNTFLNIEQGFNILGTDTPNVSQRTVRVLVENNIVHVIGSGSDGRIFGIEGGPNELIIDHNTAFSQGPMGFCENYTKSDTFYFENNIITNGSYGFSGTGTGEGISTLNAWFTDWTYTNNAIIGGSAGPYPSGNYFPADTNAVGFVNFSSGDYNLSASSPYKNLATDGTDIGANYVDSIYVADSCAMSGQCGCSSVITAIKQLENTNTLSIYPNPAGQKLNIKLSSAKDKNAVVNIMDVMGRIILETNTQMTPENVMQLDVSSLPNGLYFIKIMNGSSANVTKFVKM
jgi:type IX secretion system substrate protein